MRKAYIELRKGRNDIVVMSLVMPDGTANAFMTEEEAQTLSNRLQSLAKSQGDGSTEVLFK